MPRFFDGDADWISLDIGACGNDTEEFTWAHVIQKVDDTVGGGISYIAGVGAAFSCACAWGGSPNKQQFLLDGNGNGSFSSSSETLPQSIWGIIVYRHGSGATGARHSTYRFDNLTWSHFTGTDPLSDDDIQNQNVVFGDAGPSLAPSGHVFNGHIDRSAYWTSNLSDGNVQTLSSLSAWTSLAPQGRWVFDQNDVATPVQDATGNGANEVGRNGTSVSGLASPFDVTTPGSNVFPHPVNRRRRLLAR